MAAWQTAELLRRLSAVAAKFCVVSQQSGLPSRNHFASPFAATARVMGHASGGAFAAIAN